MVVTIGNKLSKLHLTRKGFIIKCVQFRYVVWVASLLLLSYLSGLFKTIQAFGHDSVLHLSLDFLEFDCPSIFVNLVVLDFLKTGQTARSLMK